MMQKKSCLCALMMQKKSLHTHDHIHLLLFLKKSFSTLFFHAWDKHFLSMCWRVCSHINVLCCNSFFFGFQNAHMSCHRDGRWLKGALLWAGTIIISIHSSLLQCPLLVSQFHGFLSRHFGDLQKSLLDK
jgi:hypothetical protein